MFESRGISVSLSMVGTVKNMPLEFIACSLKFPRREHWSSTRLASLQSLSVAMGLILAPAASALIGIGGRHLIAGILGNKRLFLLSMLQDTHLDLVLDAVTVVVPTSGHGVKSRCLIHPLGNPMGGWWCPRMQNEVGQGLSLVVSHCLSA